MLSVRRVEDGGSLDEAAATVLGTGESGRTTGTEDGGGVVDDAGAGPSRPTSAPRRITSPKGTGDGGAVGGASGICGGGVVRVTASIDGAAGAGLIEAEAGLTGFAAVAGLTGLAAEARLTELVIDGTVRGEP